jgi:RHS repeat-associated protein
VTPTVSRVDLLFSGANTSAEYTYEYDGAGNMVSKVTEIAGSATVTETRTVNSLNQITANSVVGSSTTNWSFTYDTNGNMKTRVNTTLSQTTTYSWDEDNRLTQVLLPSGATVSYTYDVKGRMLSRTDSGGTTTFVWDGMDCVMETDPSGNVTRYYIPKGRLMSFDRTVSGTTTVYQVHTDALGSVRKVTSSSASVIATYDYDAWGNLLPSSFDSLPGSPFLLRWLGGTGVRFDAATGLYYMRQRWYDPTIGRFASRDPLQSVNRYAYTGNPIRFSDPSGLVATQQGLSAVQFVLDQQMALVTSNQITGLQALCRTLHSAVVQSGGNIDDFVQYLQALFVPNGQLASANAVIGSLGLTTIPNTYLTQPPAFSGAGIPTTGWGTIWKDNKGFVVNDDDQSHHLMGYILVGYHTNSFIAGTGGSIQHKWGEGGSNIANTGDMLLGSLGSAYGSDLWRMRSFLGLGIWPGKGDCPTADLHAWVNKLCTTLAHSAGPIWPSLQTSW